MLGSCLRPHGFTDSILICVCCALLSIDKNYRAQLIELPGVINVVKKALNLLFPLCPPKHTDLHPTNGNRCNTLLHTPTLERILNRAIIFVRCLMEMVSKNKKFPQLIFLSEKDLSRRMLVRFLALKIFKAF